MFSSGFSCGTVQVMFELMCSWVSFLFIWFLVCGFCLRYPFPEIRDEVPENFSKRLNFLIRLRQGYGQTSRGFCGFRPNHDLTLMGTKPEVEDQTSRLFVFISGLEIL